MAKKRDEELFKRLRSLGVRKGRAREVAEAMQGSPKAAPEAARHAVADLSGAVVEIQDRMYHGPEQRRAAARKGSAAKPFKTPAIAAGVGLAGVAGGIALRRGTQSKKSLSVPLSGRSAKAMSKKLPGAVKNVGAVMEQTGQVAERVRQLSEAIGREQSAARRSRVGVVLEGLTKRSGSAASRT